MTINIERRMKGRVRGYFSSIERIRRPERSYSDEVNGNEVKIWLEQKILILKKIGHILCLVFRWGSSSIQLLRLVLESGRHRSKAEQITFECQAVDSLQRSTDLCNEQLLLNFRIDLRMETDDDGLKMEQVQVTA
jgi:hypothetical protein